MGFAIDYRLTTPVDPAKVDAINHATEEMCRQYLWLGCEPVRFFSDSGDGHLSGASKPNFMPDPEDAASAASTGLSDGTTRELLEILCRLSRDHGVDWEIGHDHSNGPIGYIRAGNCDEEVATVSETFDDLRDILGELDPDDLD